MRRFFTTLFLLSATFAQAQFKISGHVTLHQNRVEAASLTLLPVNLKTASRANGEYLFDGLAPGTYQIKVTAVGAKTLVKAFIIKNKDLILNFDLADEESHELADVDVTAKNEGASGKLRQVEGTAIYAGKKTEVINLANINANMATNNARQIYARVAGLNIWDYDGGGLQLGIGGRGLNPSRVSNFNTRQNGYDISADALGYPESYYTPPTEALDRIEIVRGAASLQYGTQFGGLINFQLKKGPKDKEIEFTSRQTAGSFGFFNSFNSIGGQANKLNYYIYYQYKRGDNWRPNGHFDQKSAYAHLDYDFSDKLKLTAEYTHMNYLAQQPGGLTDNDFALDPAVSVRARNWFKVNWNLFSLSADYQLGERTKLNWRNFYLHAGRDALGVLNYINRPDDGLARDLLSDTYNNFGSELRLLHNYGLMDMKNNSLLTGVRFYRGSTDRAQGDADDGSGPTFNYAGNEASKSKFNFPGTNVAAFTENIFRITNRWSITPGVRFEYICTKADGYYYEKLRFVTTPPIKNLEHKENNRSFVFFGVGTSYKPIDELEIYANISQNYKSVNFNDIRVVNPNARVDANLSDEFGYTADGGLRGNLKEWMYYDLSVFYLRYNGRIGSVFKKDSDSLSRRVRANIADSRNIGFESLIEADILKAITHGQSKHKLSVYTNFALIDARYINSTETAIQDNQVEFVPPLLFRTGASFGNKTYNLSLQYSYVDQQYSDATNAEKTDTAVDGLVPAYQVMDFSASYKWKWFTLSGSINNLLNEKYFTRRADGYPGPGILPSDPRTYYITLQFKL
ncbi:TonB-dependent receptor domain-containing protein [Pedobacter endophyticus]|uniref:TonB-dependent receptor n=1 Tax=Pedobacter endophyticus TaxID=2789740 RepID=A0A7S9KZC2_9SPHI|nr:TonB-dependent receptor [Pedobacter endophyticus]QPH39281.1 TonB-dependent receptor [Pedobacter endophyticus]